MEPEVLQFVYDVVKDTGIELDWIVFSEPYCTNYLISVLECAIKPSLLWICICFVIFRVRRK